MNPRIAIAALAVLATVTLASCSEDESAMKSSAASPSPNCLPSPLVVTPQKVAVGKTVTLSAPAAKCETGYDANKTYSVRLGLVGRAEPRTLGVVPVTFDGSFAAQLTIPADVPPGESYLVVEGSSFDNCDDVGGDGGSTSHSSASCAGYSVRLELTAK